MHLVRKLHSHSINNHNWCGSAALRWSCAPPPVLFRYFVLCKLPAKTVMLLPKASRHQYVQSGLSWPISEAPKFSTDDLVQCCLLLHITRCHDSTRSNCTSACLLTLHKICEARSMRLLASLSLGVQDMLTILAASLINNRVSSLKSSYTNRTCANTEHKCSFLNLIQTS